MCGLKTNLHRIGQTCPALHCMLWTQLWRFRFWAVRRLCVNALHKNKGERALWVGLGLPACVWGRPRRTSRRVASFMQYSWDVKNGPSQRKKKKKQKERESKREKWSHYSRPLTGAACFCSTSRGDWILACTEEAKCVCTSRCVYTRAHYTENCSIYIICIYRSVCVSEYSRDLPC